MGFAMVFFAIWWAWMNFTWFASAYDSDDVPYRLAVLRPDDRRVDHRRRRHAACSRRGRSTWRSSPATWSCAWRWWHSGCARLPAIRSGAALRFDTRSASPRCRSRGLPCCSCPCRWLPGLRLLAALELVIPVWAERAAADDLASAPHRRALRSVHHHRARRIDPLGRDGRPGDDRRGPATGALAPTIVGGLLIVFSMWWMLLRPSGPRPADEPAEERSSGATATTVSSPRRRPSGRDSPSLWIR